MHSFWECEEPPKVNSTFDIIECPIRVSIYFYFQFLILRKCFIQTFSTFPDYRKSVPKKRSNSVPKHVPSSDEDSSQQCSTKDQSSGPAEGLVIHGILSPRKPVLLSITSSHFNQFGCSRKLQPCNAVVSSQQLSVKETKYVKKLNLAVGSSGSGEKWSEDEILIKLHNIKDSFIQFQILPFFRFIQIKCSNIF